MPEPEWVDIWRSLLYHVSRATGGVFLLCAALALMPDASVHGQPVDKGIVSDIRQAYQALNYDRVEALAGDVMSSFDRYSVEELVEVHILLALVKYARNEQAASKDQFRAALSLQPSLELDPVLVSPKVRDFFEGVKATADQEDAPGAEVDESVRYIFVEDSRPKAAIRSLLLPGWGQFYRGDRKKGWALTGLWTSTVTAAAVVHVYRLDARAEYREARLPEDISARYDRYNRLHKTRTVLLWAAAGVWVFSYLDALLIQEQTGLALTASAAPVEQKLAVFPLQFSVTWTF